jgi:tripartite-type tricarboxylate transporter receptor subunit TctC
MEYRLSLACRILFAIAAAFASACAWPQEYPNRPIRVIVPFAAGGATDLLARELGQKLTERWHQQVVTDNRPGAGGIIGLDIGAKAAPDGYTLVMCSSSTLAIGPALGNKLPYDPIRSFTPITEAAVIPVVLVAYPSVPARSLPELIQLAKSKPGQLAYGSNGVGTTTHIAGEVFKRVAGIDLVHVPYKGGGAAISDAIGGQIPLLFGAVSTPLPHIKAGKLRALGVTNLKRLRELPDVPTFAEVLPGFEVVQWFSVCGPAGIPRAIVTRLSSELISIVDSFATNERILRAGLEPVSMTQEAYAAYVKAEFDKWTRLLKEMGIQGELP